MTQPKDFGFNEECAHLKQSAREFFKEKLPTHALHKLVANESDPFRSPDAKWDKKLWQEMIQLGWQSIVVPESVGGVGMPLVAAVALIEEAGRAALPSPLLTTLQSSCVLNACNNNSQNNKSANALLEKIAQGAAVTLALLDKNGSGQSRSVSATKTEQGFVLNGTAYYVQDAAKADYFIVACRGDRPVAPTDCALYAIPCNAPGMKIIADHIVDLTRDQAHIEFDNVILSVGATGRSPLLTEHGESVLKQAEPAILTLLAADMVGAAEWQLQTTVEYARSRVQFDRPIGFFQAVKHPLVDLMLMIDQARALVYSAACAIDHEPESAKLAHSETYAHMAKASACDMAAFASKKSVQLHGGIGFTWECFVHIYSKRQKHSQMLWGDAMFHRSRLADLIL